MLNWDNMFKRKLKSLGIHLDIYKRYVDDIFTGLNHINKGWKYNSKLNKMEFNQNDKDTDIKTGEERTAEILVTIANTIDPKIQLTWDIPGKNPNKRMPRGPC